MFEKFQLNIIHRWTEENGKHFLLSTRGLEMLGQRCLNPSCSSGMTILDLRDGDGNVVSGYCQVSRDLTSEKKSAERDLENYHMMRLKYPGIFGSTGGIK
ncbi:MAG: hypothetical protein ABIB79_02480 [archaeon]